MVAINFLFAAATLYAGTVSALPMPDSTTGNEISIPALDDANELMYSSPDTGYGAPSPSYGGDSNNNGGSGNSWSSSTDTSRHSSTSQWQPQSTPVQYNSMNTWTGSSAPPAYTGYGSGSNNWGSGYDSCVQQCQAQFGTPSATQPPPSMNTGSSGSGGGSSGGATHTVIVAPSQGVLRYVPFALNASVGDTVKFVWGANNHTVTKSSELTPCNKTSDTPFTSGVQVKDFVFEQVINDTNPLFFYCGVPTHCQKGMFGIINPPSVPATTNTSVGSMMQSLVSQEMIAYATNATSGDPVASNWGQNLDMSALPAWSHQVVAENVLYTQTFLAANKDAVAADGTVDAGLGGNPPVVPMDITMVNASTPTSVGSTPPASSSNVIKPSNAVPAGQLSGASSVSRSGALVGFAALAAGFFLL